MLRGDHPNHQADALQAFHVPRPKGDNSLIQHILEMMTASVQATDKKEAQHFFSSATTDFFVETVSKLKFTDVLCIGCPSIFELLPKTSRSLLLDLDVRLQVIS